MFKKSFLALAVILNLAVPVASAAPAYTEGKEYIRLSPAKAVQDPSKIEVQEFFWYACPHCYRLQAPLNELLAKQTDINHISTPAVMNVRWGILAKAYYAQQAIGPVDPKLHAGLFKAFHEEKVKLEKPEELYATVAKIKGDAYMNKFKSAYESFAMTTKVAQGQKISGEYKLEGTPTVVVNGTYAVSPLTAGSELAMVPVVDYLIKMERAKKAKK